MYCTQCNNSDKCVLMRPTKNEDKLLSVNGESFTVYETILVAAFLHMRILLFIKILQIIFT